MSSNVHSIQDTAPSRMGEPSGPGRQRTPSNLSAPPVANWRQSGSWSAARTLTQNARAVRRCSKLPECVAGKNAISGGSRETEENVPTTMPAGLPSAATAVTTATPVG